MKKAFFPIIGLFTVTLLQAQNIDESAVPIVVRKALEKMDPNIKIVKWEKDEANYEADFQENNKEESVTFDPNGKFVQSEKEITVDELPKAAIDYLAKKLPGKKIKEAIQLENAADEVTYQAIIKGVEYTFDINGNFLKKEEGMN